VKRLAMHVSELPWIDPEYEFWSVRHQSGVSFLDSAMRGHSDSRWSYLAIDPAVELEIEQDGARARTRGCGEWERVHDWRSYVRRKLADRPEQIPPGAPPFACGWMGWWGYELGSQFDAIAVHSGGIAGAPLASLAFYDAVDCFDNAERRRWRVRLGDAASDALEHCSDLQPAARAASSLRVQPSLEHDSYIAAVRKAQKYILSGDIYQVNLSRQFASATAPDAPDAFFRLRQESPAPYTAFLSGESGTLVSSSPELFLSFDASSRVVQSRPIKGTRPRGDTHEEDVQMALELSRSSKDAAENVMIVDLVRNDLGRICETGSVAAPEICRTEIHPGVFHLVSTVCGRLAQGLDAVDALGALFPGGSITGAPKIRACQIIRELEPTARGPYTGALGYLSLTGDAKLAMSIRVIWASERGFLFSAGGAIVADSDPESEFQETETKVAAIRRALGAVDA